MNETSSTSGSTGSNASSLRFIGLENYLSILKNPNMSIAFKNTFLFTIVTTAGKVCLGMLLAVLLNRKLRTTNYLRTVFYLPAVVNSIAIGIVFTSLMHPSKGLINTVIRGLGMTGFQPKWLTHRPWRAAQGLAGRIEFGHFLRVRGGNLEVVRLYHDDSSGGDAEYFQGLL